MSMQPAIIHGTFHCTFGAHDWNRAERAIRASGQRDPEQAPEPLTFDQAFRKVVLAREGRVDVQSAIEIASLTGAHWLDVHARLSDRTTTTMRLRDLDESLSAEERRLLTTKRPTATMATISATVTNLMRNGSSYADATAQAERLHGVRR